jgi:hypothetical protein
MCTREACGSCSANRFGHRDHNMDMNTHPHVYVNNIKSARVAREGSVRNGMGPRSLERLTRECPVCGCSSDIFNVGLHPVCVRVRESALEGRVDLVVGEHPMLCDRLTLDGPRGEVKIDAGER